LRNELGFKYLQELGGTVTTITVIVVCRVMFNCYGEVWFLVDKLREHIVRVIVVGQLDWLQ